jgi:transposase
MDKTNCSVSTVFVGIDVSAREMTVAVKAGDERDAVRSFPNTTAGHQQLRRCLNAHGQHIAVCLEASGNYSLDLCLALHADAAIELTVVNPRLARRFAESLGTRSKTDPVDARVLCAYAQRMPPVAWQPPNPASLRLRALTRAVDAMTRMLTQEKARQHAAEASAALPRLVITEIRRHQHYLEQRIQRLRREAVRVVREDADLARRFRLLQTTPGIAEVSALQVLGELAVLPTTLDARQWVAHAGLDPRQHRSGTSVQRAPRLSKVGNQRLRRALYMPALVAVRHDPHLRGFYQRLCANGKAPLQAVAAVMRKLLHAFHAIIRLDQPYDGARLCPAVELASCP